MAQSTRILGRGLAISWIGRSELLSETIDAEPKPLQKYNLDICIICSVSQRHLRTEASPLEYVLNAATHRSSGQFRLRAVPPNRPYVHGDVVLFPRRTGREA